MNHRHIIEKAKVSRAAIDDIIGRGKLTDWHELRHKADADVSLVEKILAVCNARCTDPYEQRYFLWRNYALSKLA